MSKRSHQPVDLAKLVHTGRSGLANIAQRSQSLMALQDQFRQNIDGDLAPHCQVLNYQNGVLSVQVDSSVWQWRLNMQKAVIMTRLRQAGFRALSTIESQVKPASRVTTQTNQDSGFKVNRVMSHQAACDLRSLAENAPEPLKSQLLKLAAHEKTKPA